MSIYYGINDANLKTNWSPSTLRSTCVHKNQILNVHLCIYINVFWQTHAKERTDIWSPSDLDRIRGHASFGPTVKTKCIIISVVKYGKDLICGCCPPYLRIYSIFLNKIEHRDLRRQVGTRGEAKRSEQTLPTSEIRDIFAVPSGIFL